MAIVSISSGALSSPSAKPAARSRAIDGFLIVSMCGLAFLLASTSAYNSELWLHLASGRWLSAGRLPDGTDPFSSATQGVFWVNPTWLSDLLFYWIYQLGDGTALVVVKAVLMALLAALLCCFRRRGEGMGVLTLGGFAAILALGPWLALHPDLISLFGVLLTLYLLERPNLLADAAADRARKERWLLVPLFAVWANLDGWFILGPLLVGLYALGSILRTWRIADSGLLLALAGLAACLATPYHYRIFAWPTPLGLTHAEQALRDDPLGQTLILSPFAARFADSSNFRSPGAWAYYFLLTVSAASFVLKRTRRAGSVRDGQSVADASGSFCIGRFLVWLGLAALSIYQARTIPFFAVAAAPFLGLNVHEWSRGRPFSEPLLRLRIVSERVGVLVGIALLVLAWPGWLQPAPYQPRSWAIEPDDSLVRLTQRLTNWHAQARLRPDRSALTFSPEVAHYLAWFCPEEEGFVDSRWPLFDGVADDYARMRRCLLQQGGTDSVAELASLLDAHRIDRILLHDTDWERMSRAYRHLFLAPSEWELLAVEGGATVFRRRAGSAPSAEAFDFQRAVYHPARDRRVPLASSPPQPPGPFDAFWGSRHDHSADREEAAVYLLSFDLQAENLALSWVVSQTMGLIGCGAGTDAAATATALAARFALNPAPPLSPPETLLLAVRAARRALAVDPDDGRAFLMLGEAYYRLARQTSEMNWQPMIPDFATLRHDQLVTALEQAVLLRPDLDRAHALLAQLYIEPSPMFEEGQGDRCLEHIRARLRLAERPELHAALRADADKLQNLVNNANKVYQANVVGKTDPTKVLARAQLAARYGLSRLALDLMLESNPAIFGQAGVEYEMELMLQAGQGYQLLDTLKPDDEQQFDFFFKYHWVKARAAVSCGDYAEAAMELDKGSIDKPSDPRRRLDLTRRLQVSPRLAMAFRVARAVLTRPSDSEGVAGRVSAVFFQFYMVDPLEEMAAGLLRKEADLRVLRGLVALEAGAVEEARQHFRAARDVWGSESMAASGGGLDFPARPIAQQMLRRMEE